MTQNAGRKLKMLLYGKIVPAIYAWEDLDQQIKSIGSRPYISPPCTVYIILFTKETIVLACAAVYVVANF